MLKQSRITIVLLCLLALLSSLALAQAAPHQSQWVYFNSNGKLAYRSLPMGDHIMDFSYAGYGGGGVAIPDVPQKIAVGPSGGDDSANLQTAIDTVSAMPLVDGFRGAVVMSKGTFQCAKPLTITASGVVLRGSDGTILQMTGAPHLAISVDGHEVVTDLGVGTVIADAYLPSGSDAFTVKDAHNFSVGDTIEIDRPVTAAWVHLMGMDKLTRHSKPEHWLSGILPAFRKIQSISGNRITIDVPLSDSYDAQYLNPPGTIVKKVRISGLINHVGIEHFRLESSPQHIEFTQPTNHAFHLNDVVDCWARDLDIYDTVNSILVNANSSRVTIEHINIVHTAATLGDAKPADFGDAGTQVLFDRCSDDGSRLFFFTTWGHRPGPNVVLNCLFKGDAYIQPHMRWSTGVLIDNCQTPGGGIDLMNRGTFGSGHGWTMGWGVAWNCTAKTFLIQQPPGSMNWAIGCTGQFLTSAMDGAKTPILPMGTIDSPGVPVVPKSLYLEQLRERLGDDAVHNIGY